MNFLLIEHWLIHEEPLFISQYIVCYKFCFERSIHEGNYTKFEKYQLLVEGKFELLVRIKSFINTLESLLYLLTHL